MKAIAITVAKVKVKVKAMTTMKITTENKNYKVVKLRQSWNKKKYTMK